MFRVESNSLPMLSFNVARFVVTPLCEAATELFTTVWSWRPRPRRAHLRVAPMDADWLLKQQIASYKQGDDI